VTKPTGPEQKALTLQDVPLITQTVPTLHSGGLALARLSFLTNRTQINVEIGNLRLFFINDCRELVPLIDARINSLSAQLTQITPKVSTYTPSVPR
jgi:hypothetical protein